MLTTTDTGRDILRRYAAAAAFAADADAPATDLATFTDHLTDAADHVADLDLAGADEVATAAALLADAPGADPDQRPALLARTAALLRIGQDALEEYRLMC